MIRTFLRTIMFLAVWLIVFDVIGVIACVIFDVVPFRGSSGALPYAIWFVLGIFAGGITVMSAGDPPAGEGDDDWTDDADAPRKAAIVFLTSLAMLGALAAFFNHIYWSQGVEGEYFVPDSMPHTITYFVSILAPMLLVLFTPKPRPSRGA
ncbi:MAG TPA: hypothetical protein VIT38_04860 [Allosphingosinicella sp.]|jgi:hypothetical protein